MLMNKRLLLKVFYSSIVSYIIVAKLLTIQRYDFFIMFNDLIVLFCCVYVLLFIWGKSFKLKYKLVALILIACSLYIQSFYSLFVYLTKDNYHDPIFDLLLFDIPNVLSLIPLIVSFKLILTNDHT